MSHNFARQLHRLLLSQRSMPSLLCHRRLLGTPASSGAAAAAVKAPEAATVRLPKNYEPDYLDVKPDYPALDQFQISLTANEFPKLEAFATYALRLLRHRFPQRSGLQSELIAWPMRKTMIDLYQAESSKVRDSFQLNTYRRVLVVDGLPGVELGLLVNILSQNLPEGVKMTLQRSTEEDTEFRYVPDLEVQALKQQVDMAKTGKVKV